MRVEPRPIIRLLSAARDRKRLIEESFYSQSRVVALGCSEDDQNDTPGANLCAKKDIIGMKNSLFLQASKHNRKTPLAENTVLDDLDCIDLGYSKVDQNTLDLLNADVKESLDKTKEIFLHPTPVDNANVFECQLHIQPPNNNKRHKVISDIKNITEQIKPISSLQLSRIYRDEESENSLHDQLNFKSESHAKELSQQDAYISTLNGCLKGAGENAFGIAAIEIWTMEKKELVRCEGGYWRDPVYQQRPVLERLEDPLHPEYAPCIPSAPGYGTAGKLWAGVCGDQTLVKWVDLYQLSRDESHPENVPLTLLAQAFGLALGMYFHNISTNTRGIVIFYARDTVDFERISSKSNVTYLRTSVDVLASVVSWKRPREKAIMKRREEIRLIMQRVKVKLCTLRNISTLDDTFLKGSKNISKKLWYARQSVSLSVYLKERIIMTISKIIDSGGQKLPRPHAKTQVLFALFGCFLSLLTLSITNEVIKYRSDGDISMLFPPFGALVTCHYGLTSAPASQPRNSFVGILITSTMATISAYIPVSILPLWVRIPVVTSIAIATTLALGFTHPPAGGIAIVFAQAKVPAWLSMGVLLFGYTEAIFFALVFINLHENATFPIYWGILNPKEWFSRR